ncbi:uncharacterized protein LOC116110721 [Pistacia vera]|uniref:uncharacterized protein LOC116110721 n=1 Tax=Pistacia vera TaxID=55513 RepID=UPI0012635238|nr:uncharacterized protein LOC116110721 [Pistacia vera]
MSGSGSSKKLKSSASSSTALNSNDHEEETDSPFSPLSKGSQRRQSQASLLEMKKKDKELVHKMLAKCFVVNNIAFNVVQTGAFGEFVKAMAEYGAAYKLPSYSTLRTKLIPKSRKGVDEYVAMVKRSWDTSGSGCNIMFDIWTDIRHRSFINLVAYLPSGAVFIKSLDVSRERKTGIYLKEIVVFVIESIGQEHLLLKDIYEEVNWVKVATDEARIIVMFMTKYTNELRLFVASSEWRGFDYYKTESGKRVTEIVQSDFWARGREVIKTIEPLIRVLRLVDGDGSTAGYLYEAIMRAKVANKKRCNNEASKYGRIWELFENCRVNNIIHPIHAAVAFPNPAYFFSQNFGEDGEMKDGINFIHENLLLVEEKHPFMREVQLYRSRPATLFTTTAKTIVQTSHPRKCFKKFQYLLCILLLSLYSRNLFMSFARIWRDYNGDDLPVLKKYAIRILSQPCSTSSCERNWSAFEAAQTKKGNRLSHEMLDTLVYVMMDKFTSTMSRDLEPIDLEKLGELLDYEYKEIHMDEDANFTPTVEGSMDDLMNNDDIAWLDDALF